MVLVFRHSLLCFRQSTPPPRAVPHASFLNNLLRRALLFLCGFGTFFRHFSFPPPSMKMPDSRLQDCWNVPFSAFFFPAFHLCTRDSGNTLSNVGLGRASFALSFCREIGFPFCSTRGFFILGSFFGCSFSDVSPPSPLHEFTPSSRDVFLPYPQVAGSLSGSGF